MFSYNLEHMQIGSEQPESWQGCLSALLIHSLFSPPSHPRIRAYSSAVLNPVRQRCGREPSHLTNPVSQRLVFLLGTASSSASSTSLCCCREMALDEMPLKVPTGLLWLYALGQVRLVCICSDPFCCRSDKGIAGIWMRLFWPLQVVGRWGGSLQCL